MGNKKKVRKISVRWKIIIPSALLMISCIVLLGLSTYNRLKDSMLNMGIQEAKMVAGFAVDLLDAEDVKAIPNSNEDSDCYQRVFQSLKSIRERYNISYLSTIYTDGSQVYYGVGSDESEWHAPIGTDFGLAYNDLQSVFKGNVYAKDVINVTHMASALSDSAGGIEKAAESNKAIANQLNEEVGRFKLN